MSETPDEICYTPIGVIRTDFTDIEGMPIQPAVADDEPGRVELDSEYAAGLTDLEEFTHVILLYHFHGSDDGESLTVEPFLEDEPHGLFATRAPRRPNAIGLSVVTIDRIDGATIHVRGIDVLDETPLLDVKPYVPAFDAPEDVGVGWLGGRLDDEERHHADDRFSQA